VCRFFPAPCALRSEAARHALTDSRLPAPAATSATSLVSRVDCLPAHVPADLPPTVDIWCGICNAVLFSRLSSYVAVPYQPHLSQILTHCRPQVFPLPLSRTAPICLSSACLSAMQRISPNVDRTRCRRVCTHAVHSSVPGSASTLPTHARPHATCLASWVIVQEDGVQPASPHEPFCLLCASRCHVGSGWLMLVKGAANVPTPPADSAWRAAARPSSAQELSHRRDLWTPTGR